MKIQICNLQALERLIGNDNELEIEIRNSVVQDFTTKHLKKLATSEVVNKFWQIAKQETVDKLFKKETFGSYKLTLSDEAKVLVCSEFDKKCKEFISERLSESLNFANIEKKINDIIEGQANHIVNVMTDANIERRINVRVEQKIKEKLGIK